MHSPAPWRDSTAHSLFDNQEGMKIVDANGNPVAAVVQGPAKLQRPQEEWQDNLKLIKAAPALLKACQKALQELKVYREDVSGYEAPENVDALDETIALTKDAIYDATGEEP